MFDRRGTVASRLLALNLLLVLPVAIISLVLATATYRVLIHAIETEQARTVDEYALRTRLWLRGVLRSIELAVDGVSTHVDAPEECAPFAQSILRTSPVYKAIQINGPSGVECFSSVTGAPGDRFVRGVMERQRRLPIEHSWVANSLGAFRYDSAEHEGRKFLVVYQRNTMGGGEIVEAVLLVTPDLIDQVFDFGSLDAGATVGLVVRPTAILAVRGAAEATALWLPNRWTSGGGQGRWLEPSGQDGTFTFMARDLAGPDLAIVARFDRARESQAGLQFLFLSVMPLAILALLFLFYWRYITKQVLRGISSVEQAALAEASGRKAAAIAVDDTMPQDIRSVAEAFNRMVRTVEEREDGLRRALEANVELMKEFHHRVKNSLQVIQSFMTLSRRQQSGEAARLLAVSEAKVQVLAVAYRHGLTEEGLKDVSLAAFVAEFSADSLEIATSLGKSLEFKVNSDRSLSVDQSVPLGLAIAEIVHRRLEQAAGGTIITMEDGEEGALMLSVADLGGDARPEPASRLLLGFKGQLGAVDAPLKAGETLRWSLFGQTTTSVPVSQPKSQ